MSTIRGSRGRRRGAASVEYAVVAAMMATALAGLATLGSGLTERLATTSEVVAEAGAQQGPGRGDNNNSAEGTGHRP